MYKVRAEAVSGKNVLANGKWLTCIGNKPVHVGDLIWTDGRCVYGNFKEAQQPLVITAPVEDDVGIPIALERSPYLYTYKNKLKEIEEGIVITNAFSVPATIDEGGIVINDSFHNMINDYKGRTYKVPWRTYSSEMNTRTHKIIASNITKSGDIYTIHVKVHEGIQLAQIFKNEKLISTFELQPYADKEKIFVTSTIRDLAGQLGGELGSNVLSTASAYGYIKWGFIENENNWAIMFRTTCSMYESTSKYLGEGMGDYGVYTVPVYQAGVVAARSETLYLITKNESKIGTIELANLNGKFGNAIKVQWLSRPPQGDPWMTPWIPHTAPAINLGDSHSISLAPNATVPLQDGYWYEIINSHTLDKFSSDFYFSLSPALNISLFNPQGIQIIELQIHYYDYITITKIGTERYLLGVYSSFVPIDEEWLDYYRDCIEPGLYICENKTLTKLKNGNCLNHRLRRMKKIKKWHKRIREISLEQDDTQ